MESSSKNLIFVCVFHQTQYLDLFFLLLESIQLFGNLQNDVDLLVYTNDHFKNRIENSHFYQPYIKFHINNHYNTVDQSAKARLDLFDIPITQNYQKILYLDTDIIVRRSLQPIFDIIQDTSIPMIYALEEGEIDNKANFWGYHVFGKEVNQYEDKSAFTTGILLFANHSFIKKIFEDVRNHLHRNTHKGFYDQGHIIYHAFKNKIYNNKILKNYAINRNNDIYSPKTILHFCGGVGNYKHKVDAMRAYLIDIKHKLILHFIEETKKIIQSTLFPIIKSSNEKIEGNLFTKHHSFDFINDYDIKRKNISLICLNPTIKFGLEIGFNAGFSTLLMLISNQKLHMTCIDTGEHSYLRPCYEAIQQLFPDRINLIIGNSKDILPTIYKTDYDFVHLDGSHSKDIIISDIEESYRILKKGGIFILNDSHIKHKNAIYQDFIKKYHMKGIISHLYKSKHHAIYYITK